MSSSTKAADPAFQGAAGLRYGELKTSNQCPCQSRIMVSVCIMYPYLSLAFIFSCHDLTSPGRGGAYLYDIHFWLGKDTSQDEAGTAAIKTVELDDCLGGKAVQYRELQGHESDKFLSYFKPCIIPLEGGVASGFKKPVEEEFETKLYICKGKRAVKVKQVPFSRSSLNHDDVFILDTKDKIYQFNGATSNIQERAKALEVIQFLKDSYHVGTCDVAIVDDGKLQTESDSGEFWILFGGFAPIGRRVASEDDVTPEATPATLYSVANGQIDPLEGDLSKGMLENNKCYLLDCGDEIYVWFGRITQLEERKSACQAADDLLSGQNRPKATRVTRVIQGYESHSFKSYFGSWPAGSVSSAGAEEGRGKVAAFLKQQGVGAKGGTKGAPVSEEVPPLLAAGGKIEVWCINGSAKTSVPKADVGKFYSGDCYIILYTYHSGDKKEDFYLCWWIGKDSVEEEQKMAAQLAKAMSNSLKGRAALGHIYQGKEPPQFLALFDPMIVLKGGLSSGYKKSLVEEQQDGTYTSDSVALFRLSGTSPHNTSAVQVDAVAASLDSCVCYVLQTGTSVFAWQGNQSPFEQQQLAVKVAEILKPGGPLKHAKEGTENSIFWGALGGKEIYASKNESPNITRDPHLYSYTFSRGKFQVEEIYNFAQDDLLTEDILILDTQAEVFVWVGQSVDPKEKLSAFEVAENYVALATSMDGLSSKVPLYKITEGNEPCFFTIFFSWDLAKATVQGNSFQKKAMLLFGVGSVADRSNGSNQGGATQRAAALAALSSAFNPSSDDKPISGPSKSNQEGATQRAAALAALSSSFNPSSEKKPAISRTITNNSQSSQKATAWAALSAALTAEKKSASLTSPLQASRSPSPPQSIPMAPVEDENLPSDVVEESKEVPETAAIEEPTTETNEEESEPKEQAEQEESASGGQNTFTYEQLRAKSDNPVTGIDFKCRETYLSDEEFQTVFGITKEEFYKLPRWKQDAQKKKFDLF
ncbi:hypothetical protein V2J09_015994 [Rumex salicifolius]